MCTVVFCAGRTGIGNDQVTKHDLSVRLAQSLDLEPEDAARYVQTFLDVLVDSLARGDRIEIRNFGVFEINERHPRKARNPRTGAPVHVDRKRAIKFKAGKSLLARVREVSLPPDE